MNVIEAPGPRAGGDNKTKKPSKTKKQRALRLADVKLQSGAAVELRGVVPGVGVKAIMRHLL